jgi:gliding motility-associated-like protein
VSVVNQAEFFVPNAFSPNGDGHNDEFRPIAVGYKDLKFFKVFNRWGQEVYSNTSLETGWNGTFNNKQCDLGTYYWQIGFTDRFGKDGFLKGDVTLVR